MKNLNKVIEENPDFVVPDGVASLQDQIDEIKDLECLYEAPGGKTLVKILLKDVALRVNSLQSVYKTATHIELVALIAEMDAHLSTAKSLLNAKAGREVLEAEFDELLEEALQQ
jgi:hypothetical protein